MSLEEFASLKNQLESAVFIDFRFTDLFGKQQHFTCPSEDFTIEKLEEGMGFDGSSIRGFQEINDSDMIVIPDLSTAIIDNYNGLTEKTLNLIGNIHDPITRASYSKDPRNIAIKAEKYLKSTGVGDVAYFGPELEFFLFNEFIYENNRNNSYYFVNHPEAAWNSGKKQFANTKQIGFGEGYFPCQPLDSLQSIRNKISQDLKAFGMTVECHHHEVATSGQCEIDIKYDSLVKTADNAMNYKYVVNNVAREHGFAACFMPKPIFSDNGNGMHVHMSIWKEDKNLFAGSGYAGLSETALHFMGGILKHGRALLAITNPTTNSYKRLVPGFEAPVTFAYSKRNRSAAIRIPMYSADEKAKRVEFRCPDPTANPYLAFSALLMAGMDGIQNKIYPGDAMDKNIYDLPPEIRDDFESAPETLSEALNALEEDHDFLLKGDVFTEDVIDTWIECKREEVNQLRMRPHPYEFEMYGNI